MKRHDGAKACGLSCASRCLEVLAYGLSRWSIATDHPKDVKTAKHKDSPKGVKT